MMKMRIISLILLSAGFVIGFSDKANSTSVSADVSTVTRDIDPVQYSQGRRLFQLNCAVCHGKQGEGAPNWRTPDKNGKNPAPPLNGTGHTWHHSTRALVNVIRNGTGKIGGNMPAWKDKLSNSEIKLILSWITAQWPDELYTAWYNRFHQNK